MGRGPPLNFKLPNPLRYNQVKSFQISLTAKTFEVLQLLNQLVERRVRLDLTVLECCSCSSHPSFSQDPDDNLQYLAE